MGGDPSQGGKGWEREDMIVYLESGSEEKCINLVVELRRWWKRVLVVRGHDVRADIFLYLHSGSEKKNIDSVAEKMWQEFLIVWEDNVREQTYALTSHRV